MNKIHTLEELTLAQAKGCRIEVKDKDGNWMLVSIPVESLIGCDIYTFRIHPADEWKARLPRLKEGAEWHRNDFTNEMLEGGFRPLSLGELWIKGDQIMRTKGVWHEAGKNEWGSEDLLGAVADAETMPCRTRRPVPPEFLHPDELAEAQTCAIQHNQENAKNLRDPKGFCKVCGTDWPEAAPAPAATPTDTQETDALRESYVHLGPNWLAFEVFAKASERFERRARAAEAFNKQMADVYLKASGELQAKLRAAETKLAKWESELSKVMPQDFKDWWQNSREEWPEIARMVIEGLHKQVKLADRAAEARVKELEEERKDISSCRDAACAKLQRHYDTLRNLAVATWRTNYADEAPQWEPLPDIDGIIGQIDNMAAGLAQQVAELKWENAKILSALHLRPIAGAGPVPEGMIRLYAHRIPLGPTGAEFWSAFSEPGEEDTDYIDIYPQQQ